MTKNQKQPLFIKAYKFILDLFFPLKCVGCGKLDIALCPDCLKKIHIFKSPFCLGCNRLTPKGQFCSRCRPKKYLTGVLVTSEFSGTLKETIHKFKYEFLKDLKEPLGKILADFLKEKNFNKNFVLMPVPLYRSRFKWRGFNQAELLAKEVQKHLDYQISKSLKRIKKTKPQIELSKKERIKNIENAFKLKGALAKRVILVDDVYTTGVTLNECARVLREAGAKEVWGLVLAKD